MNNDGLDDYIFLDENGAITCYVNGGPAENANLGWVWIQQGNGPITSGFGAKREQVRLAYIYGTGRADYVVVDDITGAASVWANGGPDNAANGGWLWTPKGQIASGLGAGAGVRFADINGDGRDDYIWLSKEGKATVYINEVCLPFIPFLPGVFKLRGWCGCVVGASRRSSKSPDASGAGFRSDVQPTGT